MRATRSTLPYLIAAAGGALLVLSLFLAWVSIGNADATAWDLFSIIDLFLLVLGVAVAAASVLHVMGRSDLPVLSSDVVKWLGVIALTITATYVIEGDNLAIGAFLALLSSIAILAGAILAERPDLAARLADAAGVADDPRPPAQPPAGLGASTGAPVAGTTGTPGPASTVGSGVTGAQAGTAAPMGGGAAAAAPAESSGPPAGWYPDPQGQARLRYWDGGAWTEQTSA